MSQEKFRIVCEDDDGRCSEDAIDSSTVGCSASSSRVHNPVITDSDGFHVLTQDDEVDARGAKTCSDLIMPAVTVSIDNGSHVLLNDEVGTNAPIMNATANGNCDSVYNMNVIALSVIESLIEHIPGINSDSSMIDNAIGKDSCNTNGHECQENRTDVMETKPENTMKDFDKPLYIDDNFQSNNPIESDCCDSGSCVKENLMNALKLSQVPEHDPEQTCSKRLKELEKIHETVHFNSPIATIYEYNALSEALSDDDTDVLSPSGSDFCPASQSAYHNPGVHNNDEADITSLLKLDSYEKNIEDLHLDKEYEKESSVVNQNENRTANEVTCISNSKEDSEQSLGNESKAIITDHACSSDSQVQIHSSETIVEHVLCRTTDDTVKAAYYESCVPEVSLNCEVTKYDEDQMYQCIPSSSRNENLAIDITQNMQNNVVFDAAQDHSPSEAVQAAIPTIDSKSDYGISDEMSDTTDNPEEVVRTKQSNADIITDFSDVSFDRSTGNEIFQKEILATDGTDREELSINHQIINQCHFESMSNFQTDRMEQSADAEVDVGEHNSCNLNMRPSLGVDGELKDLAQVIDGEIGKVDGNTASGFIPLTIKKEVHEVVDCDKNYQVTYKMNDNVIKCELTKCISAVTDSASIIGKKELAVMPPEFAGIKSPKLQHNARELEQRKRKHANEETQNNEKIRKMDNDIDLGENVSVHHVPKMLKQLSSEKLSSMDEDVVWECKDRSMDIVQSKISTEYLNRQGHHIKYNEKELLVDSKSNDLKIYENEECFSPRHAANDNFKEHCETTVTDEAEVPGVTDLKIEHKIQDINGTNKIDCESVNTIELDDSEVCQFADQNFGKLKPEDDQILSSCKFITATEYLSQSSQDSGSTGFVIDESESMADICVSQSLNIQTANDASIVQSSLEKQCPSELDEPIVYNEEKESRTVILYEIDETDLNEEKMVIQSDPTFSNICDVTMDAGKRVTHDEDEQMDTALLDLYVDKAVDQMVPSYENNEPKLYACDADHDDQGTSLRVQQCFKWKYTPSCDSDISSPELPDEDQVVRIAPLKTCGKPLRLGLSKRQPMKNSLHKMFRH